MQFNDTSTRQGICQEIDSLCDSDATSYTIEDKTRRANTALQELELMALLASGTWQFDDSNQTSNPTGLQTLSTGVQEYAFDSTLLTIERVEVLLADGTTWKALDPLDETQIEGSLTDYLEVTGIPTEYYKRGKFLGLVPIPITGKVTMTNGLKVQFARTASLFTTTDTTKEPGIAGPFHYLIALKASLPYCKTYKKDRVAQLQLDIIEGERKFKRYYESRSKDESGRLTMAQINSR